MTISCGGAESIRWSLYRDATCFETSCVLSGVLSVDLMQLLRRQMTLNSRDNALNSSCFSLESNGIQLVPDIQRRVGDLLESHRGTIETGNECFMDASDVAFPVAVEDLSLGSRATELGLDNMESVFCKLQLIVEDSGAKAETVYSMHEDDLFLWKLERAAKYRVRGNEAFKQERYSSAVRLYKRALAWLDPPVAWSDTSLDTKVPYSKEELQQVNPLAVTCYANMATCYSKLDREGDVDRCITAASSALALENTHVKARYRRSQAYMSTKEFDLALADLKILCDLEPDNKLFRSALTKAKSAKTNLCKKQQIAYAKLLDKKQTTCREYKQGE
ncbi:unnamed protein product [Peronospora effusa]|uniref:peptidylprolyl isomerase n=1 Tax=Peronospora effusa TaxID=542832 RepID=A0A3R7XGU8_9STRA|nr:hypothetical protein DD237_006027 [Peronospora effusa]CAI5701497.1 unnamed protein product [Peronospora effusa]